MSVGWHSPTNFETEDKLGPIHNPAFGKPEWRQSDAVKITARYKLGAKVGSKIVIRERGQTPIL
jgi:hypothetical protein